MHNPASKWNKKIYGNILILSFASKFMSWFTENATHGLFYLWLSLALDQEQFHIKENPIN